jgi:hypothetical protein
VLAYLFWHRPGDSEKLEAYERRLTEFHQVLQDVVVRSGVFRVEQLPFTQRSGYEDWYLVEDWAALGELNDAAVSGVRRSPHDAVAHLAQDGWGGVYRLTRGGSELPDGGRWATKPRDESYESFLHRERAETVWQRQLVLGPAPEFFLSGQWSEARPRVWPR